METAQIYEKLSALFQEVLDDDTLVLRPDLTAKEVDGWDSLSHIRLMLTIQKTFGMKFSAAEIAGLKNVGELAALIQRKQQAESAA